jgi:pyruvate ferredoxin oxidoreductase alpha subunit
VRRRLLRPYPVAAIRAALAGKRAGAVIDQNLSMGKGGVLHTELASALYGFPTAPPVLAGYVGGLGGRDVTAEEFYEIADELKQAIADDVAPEPRLLYTESELRQFKGLQAIALAERQEIEAGR